MKLKWSIAEKTPGGSNAILQFGWMASQEDAIFAASRTTNDMIVHLPDTVEAGAGIYTTQFTNQPYTLSRGGITSFGDFTVGKLGALTAVEADRPIFRKNSAWRRIIRTPSILRQRFFISCRRKAEYRSSFTMCWGGL